MSPIIEIRFDLPQEPARDRTGGRVPSSRERIVFGTTPRNARARAGSCSRGRARGAHPREGKSHITDIDRCQGEGAPGTCT